MTSTIPEATAEFDRGAFGPEEVTVLRASFNQARGALPPERQTPANVDALATAIVQLAKHGERDPVRLSDRALKAITPEATDGAI